MAENTMVGSNLMEKIVALCKRRGFIYPGSEIYGGIAGFWDYGPLGVELKNNIKKQWWKSMVNQRDDVVGIDGSIIMNPKVWQASGHVEAFTDPLIECKKCHHRFRADHLVQNDSAAPEEAICPNCKERGQFTKPRKFNLLVKTYLGVVEGEQVEVFLRGEITQGAFVNFKNVLDSTRIKIPFGIAQIGKAFRNEITPGNFTYRSKEFEQMELEFFIKNNDKEGDRWFEYWKDQRMSWYCSLGLKKENLRFRKHEDHERAHYARFAEDIEYNAPFGWSEFEGIHHRGDWDLSRHNLTYKDEETGEEFTPWVIETSGGVDRSALFFLIDSYFEDPTAGSGQERVVLRLHPKLAPVKVAVFPLLANKEELVGVAKSIYKDLKQSIDGVVAFDDRGNIGKRYFSQDEIGTPWCVTVDFQSLEDKTVTVRDRDTTKQERIEVESLASYFAEKFK
ncbi:MAG: glycine--tRNA ligase [Candidatus Levybacteria bacterium]|nr:glycine--tRNA ligase [Candidatus Levybacteria bacterium]MBI3069729.1 glycine--tRNA ligase [Candidatus Levybacteria bacterium]